MRRTVLVAGLAMFVFVIALSAEAHTESEIEKWEQSWAELYEASPNLAHELDEARFWWEQRHQCFYHDICPAPEPAQSHEDAPDSVRPAPRPSVTPSAGAEAWRGLIAGIWPANLVDRAVCVVDWESSGNPGAQNSSSGAAGLFQVMPFWFVHFGGERFDPTNNTRVAYLVYQEQGWGAWAAVNRGKC
jgi:hypothetical protein